MSWDFRRTSCRCREWGYDTALVGKWHLGYEPQFHPSRHGFEEFFGIPGGNADYFRHTEENVPDPQPVLMHNKENVRREGYLTDLFAVEAIRWLKERRAGTPFFLYLPFNAPHTPIQDPDEFDAKLGTAPVRQGDRKVYARMVERLDARIGEILAQVDAMGARESTIVWFISDNGGDPNGNNDPWRGRKSSVYEGGIRAASAIRWPGRIPAGKTCDQIALTMDFLPTLVAAAGGSIPASRKLDGMNLLPYLEKGESPIPRDVFWRGRRGEVTRKAVRSGDWKLVDNNGERELYNLKDDPSETKNRIGEAGVPDLAPLLSRWEQEVRAPRLKDYPG